MASLAWVVSALPAAAEEPTILTEQIASAEPGAQAEPSAGAQAGPRRPLLPVPNRLTLTWPVRPLSFAYRGWDAGTSATGPLLAFEARSTWLQSGRLSLATTTAALPALELDCRLTCQPVLQRSAGVEARVQLYSGAVARDVHAFVRYGNEWSGGTGRDRPSIALKGNVLRFGVGGLLDL